MLRTVKKTALAREWVLCLIPAFLLAASFPLFNFEFLAWVSFVPLFFNLKNKSKPKVFFLSFLTGVLFWLGTVYWLIHVTFAGMLLLVLYLGLYFGIFGLAAVSVLNHPRVGLRVIVIPAVWVLLEYARAHLLSGFPWALLSHSQYLNLPVIQIADITGAWGVSFLVMMVNVAIYMVVVESRILGRGGVLRKYGIVLLCLAITFGYGYYKLSLTPAPQRQTPYTVSVIQGNIPQELKWDIRSRRAIINKYKELTAQAVSRKPDLIIWPEASLPVVLEEEPDYFAQVYGFIKEIKTPLLLGAVTLENGSYYNSALLMSADGEIQQKYNKLHLVPFGEYIPFRQTFPFLATIVPIGDISPGRKYSVFSSPQHPANRFSVLICFEDLFPELSRVFVQKGAGFLVVMTNDAWFGKTSAAYQHCAASVFRAVENRRPVVRSANTGISGFVDPKGRITALVADNNAENIFIDGYLTREVDAGSKHISFYTRAGDVFIVVCVFCVLCGIIFSFRKKSS
ncbi:MAG: apolipoprotein N-acyltransferase [Candidatus Omnitrophota bacterium]|jgi:apolipoprotein N-acyltransferase